MPRQGVVIFKRRRYAEGEIENKYSGPRVAIPEETLRISGSERQPRNAITQTGSLSFMTIQVGPAEASFCEAAPTLQVIRWFNTADPLNLDVLRGKVSCCMRLKRCALPACTTVFRKCSVSTFIFLDRKATSA